MAGLTRVSPQGDDNINTGMIAGAVSGLRFDRIQSVKISIQPTIGIVAKDLDRLGLDIRSFREPLTRAIKQVIIPSIRKNFDVGGRPAWDPLAEGTVIRRGYEAWPILQVSGRLRRRATQLNIWDIGTTTAIVRNLPSDAFYGVYHQAGASGNHLERFTHHGPHSAIGSKILGHFMAKARKELKHDVGKVPVGLGSKLSEDRIKARALGMMTDSSWELPARPFILWQDEDAEKIQAIFIEWMTDRAIRVGRFTG